MASLAATPGSSIPVTVGTHEFFTRYEEAAHRRRTRDCLHL